MHVTLLAAGTRGDTQPYIALGLALKKAGHTAKIAAFENNADFVKNCGLEFYPIKGDVTQIARSDIGQEAMRADNPLKIILSFSKLMSLAINIQKDFYDACIGSDAVVYHPGASIGYFAAQRLNIPSILATPFPMTPTREFPSLIIYNSIRPGKAGNYLSHKLFEKIMWGSGSPVKKYWKKEFGTLPENFSCPYSKQITKSLPTIVSCSNYVFPRPADWPEHVYNTGYWFLDEEEDWRPSNELIEFLDKGAPPVYIGFGSIGDAAAAAQTTRLVIEALKRSGQRGILATGWNGLSTIGNLPEEIFILESAPHAWLFPRMSAVVHHGGAGTTAAGLRAGVPSILIPFSNDQFAWGRRVYELGVGSNPIPRKKLSAEKLSAAIKVALTDEIRSAARDLGSKIQSENGAVIAAQIIIQCVEMKSNLPKRSTL